MSIISKSDYLAEGIVVTSIFVNFDALMVSADVQDCSVVERPFLMENLHSLIYNDLLCYFIILQFLIDISKLY